MRGVAVFFLLLVASPSYGQFEAFLSGRGVNATGPSSWLEGGYGRLAASGDEDEVIVVAQLGGTWTPSQYLDLHVSGVARHDPSGHVGGIVEAYAQGHLKFTSDELRLKAGQFFLPTSRENRGALWTSPYTITFSALNSWIGEEVRPVGAELAWEHATERAQVLTTAVSAFRGNDSMGALLAWRGFALGNHLSVYDEVLPLPPLETLGTFFADQRDDGSKPFGRDLDGRTGFAARARWSLPERASVQIAHVANNGDRALHRGEYAWDTTFDLLSIDVGSPDHLIVAAELMTGRSGMGFPPGGLVDIDFHAGYVLISDKRGRNRFTARFDRFQIDEQDFSPAENNDESGRSWTFAWFYDLSSRLRAGAEFVQVTGGRRAVAGSLDGRTVTVELRYGF